MSSSANLICLCAIFSVSVLSVTQIDSGKIYYETHDDADYLSEEISEELRSDLGDLTQESGMPKYCSTPNHEHADCIPIKKCDKLLKQVKNKEASAFLLASRCGPPNKDIYNPNVCCGKYDNFRNINDRIKIQNTQHLVKRVKLFPKSCGRQKVAFERRIYGGTEASLGEYPWMARLIYQDGFGVQADGCSGFLVHSKFVITAAHCTHPYHTKIKGPVKLVILGDHNTTAEKDCTFSGKSCAEPTQKRDVIKVVTHPEYRPVSDTHYNDIAIIRIKRAHRSDFVQPICLLREETQIPIKYYLSGWGRTEHGSRSEVKMNVEIAPFDREECKKKFSSKKIAIIDTQICAGGERQKDSCAGDSGGPLMMVNDNETWFAPGVVSFGFRCGVKGWPGVYTNIVKFMPWIKTQMARNMKKNE
ncbi:serine protease 7 [Anoplophora glabripennis]|uniref:serine protease 7 n=1 Tax=Anoplophora glabripennis TaxID=217634 RepID=UPI0008750EFE|nr:serine protease 7 [Anoplophora glabripennis]